MAYGDIAYEWFSSGSTGASADTVHNLFGNYQGLSSLNSNEAVFVQLQSIDNDFRVGPAGEVTNNTGLKITTTWFDLPPLRAATASGLQFVNDQTATNASPMWVVWRRSPLY